MASGRIVGVAVDGSKTAENAYRWALDHLYREGDIIVAIHCYAESVSATPGISDALATSEAYKKEQQKIDKLLYALTYIMTSAGKKGHTVKSKIKGKIGECILSKAAEEKVDILVTGTRGLGAIKRAFMGSVSNYLVQNAKITVVVFRDNAEDN